MKAIILMWYNLFRQINLTSMKKRSVYIILLVVLVVAGISVAFAGNNFQGLLFKSMPKAITTQKQIPKGITQLLNQNNLVPIKSLISEDCKGKCEALVFVEEELYTPLKNSIDTWKKDVEKEFNANVAIIHVPNPTSYPAASIRSTIWNYANAKEGDPDVFAVLFVGDIPYMWAYTSSDTDKNQVAQSMFPSDVLFTDNKNRCTFNPTLNAYNMNGNFGCNYKIDEWPFVIGRLRPYGDTATRVDLIKQYFARNHAYRIAGGQYGTGNGELLVNVRIDDGFVGAEEFFATEKQRLSWLFSTDKLKFLSFLTSDDDTEYLDALKQNYSFVYYNGHGAPGWQQINITSKILEDTKPAALYYFLKSCSVGNIAADPTNIIASVYLFAGQGLFVYSNSTPVFAGREIGNDVYYLMTGMPIYKFYSKFPVGNYTGATILMGDPTLSIKKPSVNNIPDVKIQPGSLDFGKISLADFIGDNYLKEFKMQASNNSSKPVYIDEKNAKPQFTGDSYNALNVIDLILRLKSGYTLSEVNEPFSSTFGVKVEANSQASGTILLSLEKNSIIAGSNNNPYKKFQGTLVVPLYSAESKQIYVLDIPFNGEIVK